MSRQTLAETLKGGILLMGILLVLMALFGGLVRLGLGDPKRGPAYRVAVNIEPRTADAGDGSARPADALFDIPSDAFDVSPPERVGPEGLEERMGADARLYADAGFRMLECRRFAARTAPGDTVTACGWLMGSGVDAMAVHGARRPHPDTMNMAGIDRGYVTPDGFNFVKGSMLFTVRRDNQGDAARRLALAFLGGLAGQDFGRGAADLLRKLPTESIVPGSERIVTSGGGETARPVRMVWARFSPDGSEVSGGMAIAATSGEASAMADAAAAELAARGAVRKSPPDGPAGTFFFIDGRSPVAVGSSGRVFFRIEGQQGIRAVIRTASIFARHGALAGE